MYTHILIPTDGSPLSTVAVEKGLDFARDAGAKAVVLTVVEPYHLWTTDPEQLSDTHAEYERHAKQRASTLLAEAERQAKARGVPCEAVQVEQDDPYRAIIDTATRKGCDLIAMSSHGRRGISALVLGSETMKVLTHSTVPVLVFR